MATPETVASRDGTPIAYWRSGDGPPLVLVHGTAADHSRWVPALPALEQHFTVLAVDRRGRGGSGDADHYAIEREFEDVAVVVDRAGEGTSVLGHSLGAMCALEAALLTGNMRRLVLYEPPMGLVASPPEVVDRLEALIEAGERDEMLAVFMAEVAGVAPEQIELMRSLPAWGARLAVAHTIPRAAGRGRLLLRRRAIPGCRRPDAAAPGGRQPRRLQDGRRDGGRGPARLPGRRHARAGPRRDGHRDDLFAGEVLQWTSSTAQGA